ncbi:hypothetical protein Tco_1408464 [Tanacetum coccineum]
MPLMILIQRMISNGQQKICKEGRQRKKEEKAKEKGVSIKDVEDSSRPARSILTLKPLPTIDPKDKGKSVLEEPDPVKNMTRSDFEAANSRDAKHRQQFTT